MINHFSIFQYGRDLDNFTKGRKKDNDMWNIMKLMDCSYKRIGG